MTNVLVLTKQQRREQRIDKPGRWNKETVASYILANPRGVRNKAGVWLEISDFARYVYGSDTPSHQRAVRAAIPRQRRYMLHEKGTPFVTKYEQGGRIAGIKAYDVNEESDKTAMRAELQRALDKSQLAHATYDALLWQLSLTDASQQSPAVESLA